MVKQLQINGKTVKYPDVLYFLIKNAIERTKNKLDNVIIITGKVGAGKSNLALGLGMLYEHEMGRELSLDNIHFLVEEVLKELYRTDNKTSTIIHDEAISGSSSRDSNSISGKFLLRALITKRFKSHFIILNIDNIKELAKKTIERSVAWIHVMYVRTPEGYIKGLFKIFSSKQAERVYLDIKIGKYLNIESHPIFKTNNYIFKSYKYFDTLISEEDYENKKSLYTSKDQGILGINTTENNINPIKFDRYLASAPLLLNLLIQEYGLVKEDIKNKFHINQRGIQSLLINKNREILEKYQGDYIFDNKFIDQLKKKFKIDK